MKVYCKECLLPLTQELIEYTGKVDPNTQDRDSFINKGYYQVCDGTWGYALSESGLSEGEKGKMVINPEDLVNARNHKDRSRTTGCCGPDGCDGLNKVCRNEHEIGKLHADCWQPWAVVFENDAIVVK